MKGEITSLIVAAFGNLNMRYIPTLLFLLVFYLTSCSQNDGNNKEIQLMLKLDDENRVTEVYSYYMQGDKVIKHGEGYSFDYENATMVFSIHQNGNRATGGFSRIIPMGDDGKTVYRDFLGD